MTALKTIFLFSYLTMTPFVFAQQILGSISEKPHSLSILSKERAIVQYHIPRAMNQITVDESIITIQLMRESSKRGIYLGQLNEDFLVKIRTDDGKEKSVMIEAASPPARRVSIFARLVDGTTSLQEFSIEILKGDLPEIKPSDWVLSVPETFKFPPLPRNVNLIFEPTILIVESAGWNVDQVKANLSLAFSVFHQCGVGVEQVEIVKAKHPTLKGDINGMFGIFHSRSVRFIRDLQIIERPLALFVNSFGNTKIGLSNSTPENFGNPTQDTLYVS
ncbi:MAG: hypothetical protein KDD43_11230, partial [Bdellovibrionales bacterium]|nr:hypothetical protein [Bdellovibrionales bacterium]